jgi:hypothetical protein
MYKYNDIAQWEGTRRGALLTRFSAMACRSTMILTLTRAVLTFVIDGHDKAGLEIYRQFCHKMKEHYQTLINEQQLSNKTN